MYRGMSWGTCTASHCPRVSVHCHVRTLRNSFESFDKPNACQKLHTRIVPTIHLYIFNSFPWKNSRSYKYICKTFCLSFKLKVFYFVILQPFPLAPRKSLGLFLENGDQWKKSRTSLTPAFSTGKLRHMFSTINESVDHLVANTDEKCENGETYDVYK